MTHLLHFAGYKKLETSAKTLMERSPRFCCAYIASISNPKDYLLQFHLLIDVSVRNMDPPKEEVIFNERFVKIICVGAGVSGLCFAYKLRRSFQNYSLTVRITYPSKDRADI